MAESGPVATPTRVLRRGAAEIRVYADAAVLVEAAAQALLEVQRRGPFHLALAGGSTPEALYRRIAQQSTATWDRTQVWFGDERSVGPDHLDSNFRMAHDAMLARLPIAADAVHRMRGELPADEAAGLYEAELRAAFGDVEQPRFDLVLLGVGEDGHTASLFPGTAALTAATTRWVAANFVPKLDTWRITLTMPVLCAATRVWIFAVGARKVEILRGVLGEVHAPERWPVQGVSPSPGALVWWLDEAAAAELE